MFIPQFLYHSNCSEFFFPFPQEWLEIRGVIMIVIMKAVSLSQDYDKSTCPPTLLEYLGYICCPANCIFGPWISFAEYCSVFKKPHKKVTQLKLFVVKIVSFCFSALEYLVGSKYCYCAYTCSFLFNCFKLLVILFPHG